MWWGVLSKLAETKNNLSACNAKSKGGVFDSTSGETMWGSQSVGRGLNNLLDL